MQNKVTMNKVVVSSPVICGTFTPTGVKTLLGDASKAKNKLGGILKISFDELVAEEMVREAPKAAERDELVKKHGYSVLNYHE